MSKRTSCAHFAATLSPREPRSLLHSNLLLSGAEDARIAEAIRLAKEEWGEDHPLVVSAIESLAAKERRRKNDVTYDALAAEVLGGCKPSPSHVREAQLVAVMSQLLSEDPVREARLPGCRFRVDMLFKSHRLVVEEDGRHHAQKRWRERDAMVDALCEASRIKVLRVRAEDSIDPHDLCDRLVALGVVV